MRVLFATAEFAPAAVVGGLASASAGLVHELRRRGLDVEVVLPDYGGLPLDAEQTFSLDVPEWVGAATVRRGRHAVAGPLTLIDLPGLARPHPYLQPSGEGWRDNDQRFLGFGRAVAALCLVEPPTLLHLNDWHTATALAALQSPPRSLLSIHNLAYQGICAPEWLERIGDNPAPFAVAGFCNPLAGGIALADAVVAVSPTYADEIRTSEHGYGLDALLVSRGDSLIGIRNGVDTDIWDPITDPDLEAPFDASRLAAKVETTRALRDELGLPQRDEPLAVMVTRLTWQKGIDLVLPVLSMLEGIPVQLAVLGAGEIALVDQLRRAANAAPEAIAFVEGYDDRLSHRLFAGGDLLLMPSRFEACGLSQMQAMRYGTIPVVTDVGGLHDTVIDADRHRRSGTGFVAREPSALAVLDALHRAARTWGRKRRRQGIQKRGMKIDWSWRDPARTYHRLYENLTDRPVGDPPQGSPIDYVPGT